MGARCARKWSCGLSKLEGREPLQSRGEGGQGRGESAAHGSYRSKGRTCGAADSPRPVFHPATHSSAPIGAESDSAAQQSCSTLPVWLQDEKLATPPNGGTTKWFVGSFLPDLPSAIKQTSANAQSAVELTLKI